MSTAKTAIDSILEQIAEKHGPVAPSKKTTSTKQDATSPVANSVDNHAHASLRSGASHVGWKPAADDNSGNGETSSQTNLCSRRKIEQTAAQLAAHMQEMLTLTSSVYGGQAKLAPVCGECSRNQTRALLTPETTEPTQPKVRFCMVWTCFLLNKARSPTHGKCV